MTSFGGDCNTRARDTLSVFLTSAASGGSPSGAPYARLSACACGTGAIFSQFIFSTLAVVLPSQGVALSNDTFALWQWWDAFQAVTHVTWPYGTCSPPTGASHNTTFTQMRCMLGLPPCATDEALPRVMQVWLDSKLLNDDHTFVVQRAGPDEFYLWQSYYQRFDLWNWATATPNPSGLQTRAEFAGRLNATGIATFLDTLDTLTAGQSAWETVAPLWTRLFWVPAPSPESMNTTCPGVSSATRIPVGVGFWAQDYNPAACAVDAAALNITWDAAHGAARGHMCDGANATLLLPC